jgi:hypothetical protein
LPCVACRAYGDSSHALPRGKHYNDTHAYIRRGHENLSRAGSYGIPYTVQRTSLVRLHGAPAPTTKPHEKP